MSKTSESPTSIGGRIKYLREKEGYTREEFCVLTGIKKRTLIGIEIEGRDPQGSTLEKIARHFPRYIEYLLLGNT